MSNVVVQKNTYTVEPLYQWDVNQGLVIYGLSLASVPEVHFANTLMGKAIVRQSTMDEAGVISVEVPNSLLQKPYTIQTYICTYEGDSFETQYKLEIPVKPRSKPEDYTLEDDSEVYSFNALENQVANALYVFDVKAAEVDVKYNSAVDAYNGATAKVDAAVVAAADEAAALIREECLVNGTTVTFLADAWVDNENGMYTQNVTVPGGTDTDMVGLQMSNAQLLSMIEDGVSILKVDNNNGIFIATAVGAPLSADMTVQATLTEVV